MTRDSRIFLMNFVIRVKRIKENHGAMTIKPNEKDKLLRRVSYVLSSIIKLCVTVLKLVSLSFHQTYQE